MIQVTLTLTFDMVMCNILSDNSLILLKGFMTKNRSPGSYDPSLYTPPGSRWEFTKEPTFFAEIMIFLQTSNSATRFI